MAAHIGEWLFRHFPEHIKPNLTALFFCLLCWFVCLFVELYHFSHTCNPFCSGYFGVRVLLTISSGWPQTVILPISTSQIARITGLSHQSLSSLSCSVLYFAYNTLLALISGLWSNDDSSEMPSLTTLSELPPPHALFPFSASFSLSLNHYGTL
jgi:hypothetical protein